MLNHNGLEMSYAREIHETAFKLNDFSDFKQLADEVMKIKLVKHDESFRTTLISQIMTVMEHKFGYFELQDNENYNYISKLRIFD